MLFNAPNNSLFRGKSVNKYLLSLMVLLPLSTFVIAQEAEEADEAAVEEIVTTGIRNSLIDAINIKRKNVGVVDAILVSRATIKNIKQNNNMSNNCCLCRKHIVSRL